MSVNPVDWKLLAGAMSGDQPLAGTGYLGYDAAGVVQTFPFDRAAEAYRISQGGHVRGKLVLIP